MITGASSADDYPREPMPDTEADPVIRDASVQTEKVLSVEERALLDRINELELEIKEIHVDRQGSKQNIKDDDSQVLYYTGFKSYDVFKAFFRLSWTSSEFSVLFVRQDNIKKKESTPSDISSH